MKIEILKDEGIEGWVAINKEYAILDNPSQDSRFSSKLQKKLAIEILNLIALPIINRKNEVIGIIETINSSSGQFSTKDYVLLRTVASQIAMSSENAKLYRDLRRTFTSLTEVMATTIDAKHPISQGHSKRVAFYALGIAREMGLSKNHLEQIRIASLLHDYGKIGIPDKILKKEGALSTEEFEAMKMHAKITHDIVSKVHFTEELSEVPIIASCHHERWDGEGYPFGLAGKAIPLGSRIISVADTFDAITSFREYSAAREFEQAKEEIVAESGTHFDPQVVEAFLRYYKRTIEPKKIMAENSLDHE